MSYCLETFSAVAIIGMALAVVLPGILAAANKYEWPVYVTFVLIAAAVVTGFAMQIVFWLIIERINNSRKLRGDK